jgi:hypothetical protein
MVVGGVPVKQTRDFSVLRNHRTLKESNLIERGFPNESRKRRNFDADEKENKDLEHKSSCLE